MNVTTATPAQIDTELARLHGEQERVSGYIRSYADNIRRVAGERPRRDGIYITTLDSVIETVQAKVAAGELNAYETGSFERAVGKLETLREEHAGFAAQIRVLNDEFTRRGGWTRAFLCTNAGGHVHNSTNCSTLRITTSLKWVIVVEVDGADVEVSGMTEAQVIDLAGEGACTVCYPDAPVTDRPSRIQDPEKVAARREREAASAAKKAKAAKAAIVDADGEPLVIRRHGRNETIRTERAAMIDLVDMLWYQKHYGFDDERATAIKKIAAALAAKHDITEQDELDAAGKRLTAREKREERGQASW